MTLTSDEKTVLLIAAQGEPMMPIGRWRVSAESLVQKKYLKPTPHAGDPDGFFNLRITPAGRQAVEAAEKDDMHDLVMVTQSMQHDAARIRANAEQIAVQLVDLAQASNLVTGDAPVKALENWSRVILKRALKMLK